MFAWKVLLGGLFITISSCGKEVLNQSAPRPMPVAAESLSSPPVVELELPDSLEGKPKRAVILTTGGLNLPSQLGIYDAVVNNLGPVDYIIGNCGGSLAAAIIAAIPNMEQRRNWLLSSEFHEVFVNLSLTHLDVVTTHNVINWTMRMNKLYRLGLASYRLPDLYWMTMMDLDSEPILPRLNQAFPQKGPRLVLMATEILVDPKTEAHVLVEKGKKVFRETYFTDPETALLLKDMKAYTALLHPDGVIAEDTQVETSWSMAQAVRASISDPFMTQPAELGGRYFLTGAQNPDPISLAYHLADEAIMRYNNLLTPYAEMPVMAATFMYNPDRLRYESYRQKLDYWVDLSDTSDMQKLNPVTSLGFGIFWGELQLKGAAPLKIEDFSEVVRQQYHYAYQRTLEALRLPRGTQKHIRSPINHWAAKRF